MTGEEFAVMLDFHFDAEFAPVFGNRANAMRADGDDSLHAILAKGLDIRFRQLAEDEIVAETARGIASAALFLQDAEARSQMLHQAREGDHDLAAMRIVCAHATKPQAVFL